MGNNLFHLQKFSAQFQVNSFYVSMPRKNLIRTNQFPYHITMRSNNKEWFDLPMHQVWQIATKSIDHANRKHPAKIQAFVLMNNHYHLLIWTPNSDIDKFMYEFNKELSLRLRIRLKRINRIFGGRYKWSLVKYKFYYNAVLKYIYQNPLKKNLIQNCEDYPFSSLYYFVRNRELPFPLWNPIPESFESNQLKYLKWINEGESASFDLKLGLALRRPIFSIPCSKTLKNKMEVLS